MLLRSLGPAIVGLALIGAAHAADTPKGFVAVASAHDVSSTIDRLATALTDKGMTIFTRIDHAAGAAKAELALRPTTVLIFGNPKVGSPLMNCAQSVAIDLPQKALAWEDESGQVWLGYNDPAYLAERHGIGESCAPVLEKVSAALRQFAKAATSP